MIEQTPLFPTIVFSTHLKYFTDDYLSVIEEYKNILKFKEHWKDNKIIQQTYDSEMHKNQTYKILVDFFQNTLDEIKKLYQYDTERFEINSMWANLTNRGGHHTVHYHPNSYFSGIFYVSPGAPTIFKDPNILKITSALNVFSEEIREQSFNGQSGSLLIFPSWLYHGTVENDVDSRMTISFNSLPSGKTNYNTKNHLYSRMNIKSI